MHELFSSFISPSQAPFITRDNVERTQWPWDSQCVILVQPAQLIIILSTLFTQQIRGIVDKLFSCKVAAAATFLATHINRSFTQNKSSHG